MAMGRELGGSRIGTGNRRYPLGQSAGKRGSGLFEYHFHAISAWRWATRNISPGAWGLTPQVRSHVRQRVPCHRVARLKATVEFVKGTRACGLMLRVGQDMDSAYYLRFEPERNRLVIDSWPRAGDIPYWIDSERPIALKAGVPVKVKVFLDGSVCVVYVDERIALSTRMYDLTSCEWGVFAMEGSAKFTNVAIFV